MPSPLGRRSFQDSSSSFGDIIIGSVGTVAYRNQFDIFNFVCEHEYDVSKMENYIL